MTQALNKLPDSMTPQEYTLDLDNLLDINVPQKVLDAQEIDINELKNETPEVQVAAICQWFLNNYLPSDDSLIIDDDEKGPIWLLGGPYNAEDEILSTFESQIHPNIVRCAIEAIESTGVIEWSGQPRSNPFEDDYLFEWTPVTFDPQKNLSSQIKFVQTEMRRGNRILNNLLFSSLISALEAFIWQNILTLARNPTIAKNIISSRYKSITIDDLYKHRKLKIEEFFTKEALEILGTTVFHRTNEINSMFKNLGINASISNFEAEIEKRHDIVHRSGFTRNNTPTIITEDDLNSLISKVQTFSTNFSKEMERF